MSRKVLVFGPSGSGKTYVARALKKAGLPAFDTDEIEDLNHWYTRDHPKMDQDINGLVIWGEWFEAEAKKRGIPMIDASGTPMEIYEQIKVD